MSPLARQNKRLVLRYAATQVACAAIAAAIWWMVLGAAAARSALAGGLIAALGSVVFGWSMFAGLGWPPNNVTRNFYAGEVFKWIWIVLALMLALRFGGFAPLALVTGLVAGQFGFWLAVWLFRRG